ncbi:cyclic di-AMP binding protein CbpA [Aerococcaceae bacterium NML201209]|nr:cyclic di-AMP binding protein CbpA [Aerococcaceae bacterium NML201209]
MIDALMIHKSQLTCVVESSNCQESLALLEENHLRCAPVLDATSTLYRGNIYRYHIYQYLAQHPDADLSQIPVTHFLKNTTRVVHTNESMFQLFFAMTDLPYVAVLDAQNAFLGIIKHNAMLNFLAQAWVMDKAGFVLEVHTLGGTGELAKISKIINKYCDISTAVTLEETAYDTGARILFVLPHYLDQVLFNRLIRDLERKQYKLKAYNMK